jgi:hypothetical protein
VSENKKQRQRKNSKRIGKLVLPIYSATSKAIIKSAINTTKYNYYEIAPTNKTQVRVAYVKWCIPCTAQQPGAECLARLNFVPRHAA